MFFLFILFLFYVLGLLLYCEMLYYHDCRQGTDVVGLLYDALMCND